MFDQFKQLNQLRKMQKQMEKEVVEKEKDGVKVKVNGKMEVLAVELNKEAAAADQGEVVKNLINDAISELQQKMAQSLQM